KPCMIGFVRLPSLNSVSCLTRYSGCWPWMIGLAGLPREPSLAWQAMQTSVDLAWPFARSGFASGLASSAACAAYAKLANSRQDNRRAAIMGSLFLVQNPAILQ